MCRKDISIFFDEKKFGEDKWSAFWEEKLCSDPFSQAGASQSRRCSPRAREAKRPQIKHFWGGSRDEKNGHFFGRIHAMTPQQGIHGFQRVVMMQYHTTKDQDGFDVYDPQQVWAYEGCVLPGGSVIVGRWWDARADPTSGDVNSGPFLWWNVDRSAANVPIEATEALDFLDSLPDPILGIH